MVATPEVDTPRGGARLFAPARSWAGPLSKSRWLPPVVFLAAGLVLFVAYLWQARTVALNSDGAANALQAWDMLHGNVLLRGWSLSDVSWYTTELPQYMLVELVRGLNGDVGHIAAAITYTLVVLLAALLAKGRATGYEGAVRAVVAAGIMLAPSFGLGADELLTRPDHLGTQVPLLLCWLLLDRVQPRWWVPVVVTAVLAWTQVADTLVLYEGVLPLVIVAAVRIYRRHRRLRGQWFELALGVGAVLSAALATVALILIRHAGGFAMRTPRAVFAAATSMSTHVWITVETVLALFGGNFFGTRVDGATAIAALLHLTGVVLAGWALAHAVRRFTGQDLVVQITAVALIVLLAAYLLGPKANNISGAYELTGVLPLGAVLAGRVLAGPLIRDRLVPALAVMLVCYGALLAHHALHPPVISDNQRAAAWLQAHHLHYGLGLYWHASVLTVDSGNRVQVRPIAHHGLKLYLGHTQSQASWYDPKRHYADFVVTLGPVSTCLPRAQVACPWQATFGTPAEVYKIGTLVIMVWHKNLLDAHIDRGTSIAPPSIADGAIIRRAAG